MKAAHEINYEFPLSYTLNTNVQRAVNLFQGHSHADVVNIVNNTCAFLAVRCQNICHEKG